MFYFHIEKKAKKVTIVTFHLRLNMTFKSIQTEFILSHYFLSLKA